MADLDFAYDLTLDEARRRTAVLEAIGDDWDPIAVLAEEEQGLRHALLRTSTRNSSASTTSWSAPVCCQNGTVIVLPIDPTADRARRAWLECPRCEHGSACADCQSSRNCAHPLAVPAEQPGHGGPSAMPDLRLPVVDRHPPARRPAAQGRLTGHGPAAGAATAAAATAHPAAAAADRAPPAAAATSTCPAASPRRR